MAQPRRLDARTVLTAVGLAAVTVAAWVEVVAAGESMNENAAAFLGAWTVMMAAMMLPSAAPLVLLYARGRGGGGSAALLAGGYVVVWAAVGAVAFLVDRADPPAALGAAVLAAAGLYQFTPLKVACLERCRSPHAFLLAHWHSGGVGAVRLGVEHGAFCLGCCWALMAVLVAAGSMGLAWVVGIAAVVFAEKILPGGDRLARALGVVLFVLAAVAAVDPGLIGIGGGM